MIVMDHRRMNSEQERAIRRFLRTSLTAHGYTVYEASSGQEALSAVIGDRPDLIITTSTRGSGEQAYTEAVEAGTLKLITPSSVQVFQRKAGRFAE